MPHQHILVIAFNAYFACYRLDTLLHYKLRLILKVREWIIARLQEIVRDRGGNSVVAGGSAKQRSRPIAFTKKDLSNLPDIASDTSFVQRESKRLEALLDQAGARWGGGREERDMLRAADMWGDSGGSDPSPRQAGASSSKLLASGGSGRSRAPGGTPSGGDRGDGRSGLTTELKRHRLAPAAETPRSAIRPLSSTSAATLASWLQSSKK